MNTHAKPFIIGLTGGIACGKTAVSDRFHARGITVIDADQVARDIVQPGSENIQKIREHFGESVIAKDNTLNRRALRQSIFNHPDEKAWLENLLHPQIRDAMQQHAATATSPYVIFVIPLLLETAPNPSVDRILVIDASPETQINRLIQRDGITRDDALKILNAQVSQKDRLAKADDVITNDGDIAALKAKVDKLHEGYLAFSLRSQ